MPLIRRLRTLLETDVVTIQRFIQAASFLLKPLIIRMIFQKMYLTGSFDAAQPIEADDLTQAVREGRRDDFAQLRVGNTNDFWVELSLDEVYRIQDALPAVLVAAFLEDEQNRVDEELDEDAEGRWEWRCMKCRDRPINMMSVPALSSAMNVQWCSERRRQQLTLALRVLFAIQQPLRTIECILMRRRTTSCKKMTQYVGPA